MVAKIPSTAVSTRAWLVPPTHGTLTKERRPHKYFSSRAKLLGKNYEHNYCIQPTTNDGAKVESATL